MLAKMLRVGWHREHFLSPLLQLHAAQGGFEVGCAVVCDCNHQVGEAHLARAFAKARRVPWRHRRHAGKAQGQGD